MPKALVVADGSWVTNEVKSALSVGSWELDVVSDPRAVIDRLEDSRVDVVVVDMQIGSKGGMAVIRSIRQSSDEFSRPRLVLLLDRSADEFLARRAGADAFVLKPINAAELRRAITPEMAPVGGGEEE